MNCEDAAALGWVSRGNMQGERCGGERDDGGGRAGGGECGSERFSATAGLICQEGALGLGECGTLLLCGRCPGRHSGTHVHPPTTGGHGVRLQLPKGRLPTLQLPSLFEPVRIKAVA